MLTISCLFSDLSIVQASASLSVFCFVFKPTVPQNVALQRSIGPIDTVNSPRWLPLIVRAVCDAEHWAWLAVITPDASEWMKRSRHYSHTLWKGHFVFCKPAHQIYTGSKSHHGAHCCCCCCHWRLSLFLISKVERYAEYFQSPQSFAFSFSFHLLILILFCDCLRYSFTVPQKIYMSICVCVYR